MRLDTLLTFDQHDVQTKRQKKNLQKKTKRRKGKKKKDKKTERQRPKREFNIVTSGQFRTLAMFFRHEVSGVFFLTVK